MDFRPFRPRRFALAVGLRATAIGVLVFVVSQLLTATVLYATAILLIAVAAALVVDLSRLAREVEHRAERDFERLATEGCDTIQSAHANVTCEATPMERAAALLNAARAERHQQLDFHRMLLDTVAAALIVINPDGRVTLINRAARSLANAPVGRIHEIAALGVSGAERLLALGPGAREIMSLVDGRRMFITTSQISAPGHETRRLISLQRIAGELDLIELNAWQKVVHVLAHEMMNSLTPIASLSESLEILLRDNVQGDVAYADEVAGALEAIKRRSLGLMDFVERYRTVAELPLPKMQRVPLDQLLSGIDRLLSRTFQERGVAYRKTIAPASLSCLADPQLLEQALINLLRNAVDAVKDAVQPEIEVSCQLARDWVTIAIADNGSGIPENARDQIFVPFFTTKPGGSGIGLNLAHRIVLGHGGQLDVCRNSPRGSVFTLTLPAYGISGLSSDASPHEPPRSATLYTGDDCQAGVGTAH
jgi:two-component system nitrogen regulation sensor histidine kinase NtrY